MRNKIIYLFGLYSLLWIGISSVYATAGQCGSLNWNYTTSSISYNSSSYFCNQWEIANLNLNSVIFSEDLSFSWSCLGTNGDPSANCSYTNSTIWQNPFTITNGTCGNANNQIFSSTAPIGSDIYSNINNQFLWRLCKDNSNNNIIPKNLSTNALWWTWECPTWTQTLVPFPFPLAGNSWSWASVSCQATRYFNANCWTAAYTGQSVAPSTNLCDPWYTAWPVQFDNQTNLRSRQCNWGWWGSNNLCTARLNGPNNFAPMCNNTIIQNNWSNNYITSFPNNNACLYGNITNRQVSWWWIATRQCNNNWQLSSTCGNASIVNYSSNQWNSCNTSITSQVFDSTYQLLQNDLCQNWWIPSQFNFVTDRRKRKCGIQSCEALISNKPMCGWATQQPWTSYPTNGICNQWVASTIKQSNGEWGWICTTNLNNIQQFNNTSCTIQWCFLQVLDFYNGKTAVCSAPRITNGECKRSTQINVNGFSDPDNVLQSWLCESGYPDPLLPLQDPVTKKRKRKCKATTPLWTDSPTCYAKVKLPNMSVLYQNQVSNGTITAVTAVVTWFNNVYINFTNPVNQYYRLFTQNGHFFFQYSDWAWNTWSLLAVVDNIQNDLPTAQVIRTPSTPTSGNVVVSLTWFNRPQVPIISFSWSCLSAWNCIQNSSIHPYLFNVTFSNNWTWVYTLTDANWVTNTISVYINNIDHTPPTASLQYSNTNPTNGNVTVSIINPNEPIIVKNNNWSSGYTFTWNWNFIFNISDLAGNTTNLLATVNWINKNAPSATVVYSTTGNTTNNVVATLTNFTVPWTIITNNSGSSSHTFTYNKEFIFILKDPAGNIWSVKAKVDWINKPINNIILWNYWAKLCDDRTWSPIDTQNQVYNYHINTVINNCIMKSYQAKNNNRYFYPKKNITRWEYLTVIWRMIKLLWNYSGSILNSLSPNYIGVTYNGIDESGIGEADARWLLLYSPLIKKWAKRSVESNKAMPAQEAQKILEDALIILWNNTKASTLIKNKGSLSRAQTAYALSTIMSQYENTALWNHYIFHQQLEAKLAQYTDSMTKQAFMVQLIKNIKKISTTSFSRLWIDRSILLQDLSSITLGAIIPKKPKVNISLNTVTDFLLTKSYTPTTVNNSNQTYNSSNTQNTTTTNYFNFWSDISL